MKSKSVFLMAVSLGFGLVAAIGISQVMGRSKANSEAKTKTVPVLVAVEDLDVNTELTPEMFSEEQWPANIVPEGVASTPSEIENKVVRTRVGKRFPLYLKDLVDRTEANKLPIPAGYKVTAIKVSGDDTIGGLLQPGDLVDVIGVFRHSGTRDTTSKTFLRGIRVFSVDSRTVADINRDPTGRGTTIVGVLVTEKQSEQLVLVQKVADIKLAMRSTADEDPTLTQSSGTSLSGFLNGSEDESNPNGFSDFLVNTNRAAPAVSADSFVTVVYTADGPIQYRFGADGGLPARVDGYSLENAGASEPSPLEAGFSEDSGDMDSESSSEESGLEFEEQDNQ